LGVRPAYVEAVDGLRMAAHRAGGDAEDAGRTTVDRAVGLLAGRARCRLAEAHRHLLRTAAEQNLDVVDAAAGVIRLLDLPEGAADRGPPALAALPPLAELVRPPHPVSAGIGPPAAAAEAVRRFEPWLAMVQQVLDVLPGAAALLTPVRDPAGRLTDLIYAAVTPEAVAADGRRGAQLVGLRLTEHSPESVTGDRWAAYQEVLDTGCPAHIGPFGHREGLYSVRAHRLGQGLLTSWVRHDLAAQSERLAAQSERIAGTERLGNLGWGEWDLVSGEVRWSEQLYRIYERDPALGPLAREDSEALVLPDDLPLLMAAADAFARSERVDLTSRVRIGGRIKHLRTVADAVRDTAGHPLRIYGIVQDVTAQEAGAQRLAEVERQLAEQRRTLAAEHELAARLQQIILPIPDGPLELPGLKVALRYLPAGQESLVGGDWYHAAALRDGSVLLAVGDVAGHGTPAATTMAQLRHALRALAVTTTDPGVLLAQLNRLTCDLEQEKPDLAATAVIARYDPAARRLTWAQAGHPPPLLSRGGRTAPLSRPSGTMLGVVDDATYPCATLDLAVGDVLLLYTDGLVEHRRRSLDAGLHAVITAMDAAVAASPQQPLGELLNRLRCANPDDDTCILAARPASGDTRDLRRYLT
jgi:serine phosphatase RsbU (regulator of sigma subunit)